MGGLLSIVQRFRGRKKSIDIKKNEGFSWEREERKAIKVEDFILDKLKDQTIYRLPGSVNGQQFIIQNCDNCTVYVLDHTGQIQIDDCTNCRILIGPVRGSIFIRDSTDCVLGTICQQFRTRDCRNLIVYLSCDSQPIIESSHNVKFGCLTINYNKLFEQYQAAGINPWNNTWGTIHDFTSVPDMRNYSLMNENENLFKYLPIPTDPSCSDLNISDNIETGVTPYTHGEFYRIRPEERCFVLFFVYPIVDACAREFISKSKQAGLVLVQSKSYSLNKENVETLFSKNNTFNSLINKGPVIGLEMAGDNCVKLCHGILNDLLKIKYPNSTYFVSQTPDDARKQIDKFYNFASMEMFV